MNNDPADQKLRRLFEASRAEDALGAPAFDAVASLRRAAPRTTVRWGRMAAAAIVVLGASLALLLRRTPVDSAVAPKQWATLPAQRTPAEPTAELTQWEAVCAWRASTDSLLTISDLPVGSAITAPTDSLINSVSGETDASSDSGKESL